MASRIDTTLAQATMTIASSYTIGEDVLAFTAQNGITGAFDAASGALTLTGAAAPDYLLASTTVTTAADITPAPLTITADDQSMIYGGAVPALTVRYTGFVHGETPATAFTGSPRVATAATSSSPAGAYPITPSAGTACGGGTGLVSWWKGNGTAADTCGRC